ncbi:hypothetical protein J6590_039220 [Homalodisca vitripennis]|nr:hypothetical protein J6590_039220 [Homalodisca vitripennis]
MWGHRVKPQLDFRLFTPNIEGMQPSIITYFDTIQKLHIKQKIPASRVPHKSVGRYWRLPYLTLLNTAREGCESPVRYSYVVWARNRQTPVQSDFGMLVSYPLTVEHQERRESLELNVQMRTEPRPRTDN